MILSILGPALPTSEPGVIDRVVQATPAASRALLRSTLRQMAGQSSTAWTFCTVRALLAGAQFNAELAKSGAGERVGTGSPSQPVSGS